QAEGTYLVVGGLGGFGLAVARWLAERGARYLVLMGRAGASTPEAEAAVNELRQQGINVVVARADVTHPDEVQPALTEVRRTLPPLRGVIHSAMVLDDALLTQLTPARFRTVLAPKVSGAWNLHQATVDDPLDFFVLFSSVSATFGNRGQANYAAA